MDGNFGPYNVEFEGGGDDEEMLCAIRRNDPNLTGVGFSDYKLWRREDRTHCAATLSLLK